MDAKCWIALYEPPPLPIWLLPTTKLNVVNVLHLSWFCATLAASWTLWISRAFNPVERWNPEGGEDQETRRIFSEKETLTKRKPQRNSGTARRAPIMILIVSNA
jgi:hypothetical protein